MEYNDTWHWFRAVAAEGAQPAQTTVSAGTCFEAAILTLAPGAHAPGHPPQRVR